MTYDAPADVDIEYYTDEAGLHLTIDVRVAVSFDCYRCLERAHRTYEARYRETFGENDDYLTWSQEGGADVGEPIFEAIYATVPQSLVCRDDCLGLCPKCGTNRNLTPCACDTECDDEQYGENNPFAALLKNLK